MTSSGPRFVEIVESALAILVLLMFTFVATDLPQPFPSFPEIGGVPVDPELLVPGVLGVFALAEAVVEGFSRESIVTGIFALLTLSLAVTSFYTLYADTAGGIFVGGLFTLVAGTLLAIVVLLRNASRKLALDGGLSDLANEFGDS